MGAQEIVTIQIKEATPPEEAAAEVVPEASGD